MRQIATAGGAFAVADDKDTFWDRFESGTWEPETLATVAGLAGPGVVFVDIGAWIGPITLLAAARGARVLAFEPDPRAFALLSGNVAANPDLAGRIRLFNRALAPEAGRIRLGSPRKPGDSMGSVLMADRAAATWEAEAVTPAAVAAMLADRGAGPAEPLVLKIDIEGAEYALLPHLAPLLSRAAAALVAFHPRILAATGRSPAAIAAATAGAGATLEGFERRRLEAGREGDGTGIPLDANATLLFRRGAATMAAVAAKTLP